MVTYRNETKAQYLGIAEKVLKNPGPVSDIVARQMAESVLQRTPEGTLAASVTGHLGPQAPAELDGVVYLAVARRRGKRQQTIVRRHVCVTQKRLSRQREAIAAVLGLLIEALET
jgi:nicotinamide mononucleotide (NMN) deamidase PncC